MKENVTIGLRTVGEGLEVSMLRVGGMVRAVCPGVVSRCSVPLALGEGGALSGVWGLGAVSSVGGVKAPSGVGLVRALSGVGGSSSGGGSGTGGWYSSLADSAPVHLCEELLVGVQQVSGLPWWMSIVGTTLMTRTLVTLPLAAYQLVILSKVSLT